MENPVPPVRRISSPDAEKQRETSNALALTQTSSLNRSYSLCAKHLNNMCTKYIEQNWQEGETRTRQLFCFVFAFAHISKKTEDEPWHYLHYQSCLPGRVRPNISYN